MDKWMGALIKRLGQPAVLYIKEEANPIWAVLQSVQSRSRQNMERLYSPIGQVPQGQYLCMLPAGTPGGEGDRLRLQGKCYEISRLEPVYYGEKVAYLWGLCVEKGA